jgi:protein-S-isoprenylcysteine O-methyltransferase Ste14
LRDQRDAEEQETFALKWVIEVVVQVTMTAWLVLEAGLLIRDRIRGVLIHRIFVEEAVLTEVIGRAYADYAARTKRLVPGLW